MSSRSLESGCLVTRIAYKQFRQDLRNSSEVPYVDFIQCLPVRSGVTVTDSVLDGPRSVVIAEARIRMLVQMAVLHQLLSGSWCKRV